MTFKMMRSVLGFCLALITLAAHGQDLLLFGGDGHEDFLGCLRCNEYSSDSVCNGFGRFGNEFGSNMWNEFSSPYGNEFSSSSPWNEYSTSTSVPVLVDRSGAFYGYFTINSSRHNAVQFSDDLSKIYKSHNGNLEKVRESFCKQIN